MLHVTGVSTGRQKDIGIDATPLGLVSVRNNAAFLNASYDASSGPSYGTGAIVSVTAGTGGKISACAVTATAGASYAVGQIFALVSKTSMGFGGIVQVLTISGSAVATLRVISGGLNYKTGETFGLEVTNFTKGQVVLLKQTNSAAGGAALLTWAVPAGHDQDAMYAGILGRNLMAVDGARQVEVQIAGKVRYAAVAPGTVTAADGSGLLTLQSTTIAAGVQLESLIVNSNASGPTNFLTGLLRTAPEGSTLIGETVGAITGATAIASLIEVYLTGDRALPGLTVDT